MIKITPRVWLPEDEISFAFARSGGPGGQNVNKLNTQVTLRFNLQQSTALTAEQKRRLRQRLGKRINQAGVLQVTSRRHRTQPANRRAALQRFVELLTEALRRPAVRKATRPPPAAREKRLADKARRSATKRLRRDRPGHDS